MNSPQNVSPPLADHGNDNDKATVTNAAAEVQVEPHPSPTPSQQSQPQAVQTPHPQTPQQQIQTPQQHPQTPQQQIQTPQQQIQTPHSQQSTPSKNKQQYSIILENVHILHVQIEKCLKNHMNEQETAEFICENFTNVDPLFVEFIWNKLEDQNPAFFQCYKIRVNLRQQIQSFNEFVEQQSQLLEGQTNIDPDSLVASVIAADASDESAIEQPQEITTTTNDNNFPNIADAQDVEGIPSMSNNFDTNNENTIEDVPPNDLIQPPVQEAPPMNECSSEKIDPPVSHEVADHSQEQQESNQIITDESSENDKNVADAEHTDATPKSELPNNIINDVNQTEPINEENILQCGKSPSGVENAHVVTPILPVTETAEVGPQGPPNQTTGEIPASTPEHAEASAIETPPKQIDALDPVVPSTTETADAVAEHVEHPTEHVVEPEVAVVEEKPPEESNGQMKVEHGENQIAASPEKASDVIPSDQPADVGDPNMPCPDEMIQAMETSNNVMMDVDVENANDEYTTIAPNLDQQKKTMELLLGFSLKQQFDPDKVLELFDVNPPQLPQNVLFLYLNKLKPENYLELSETIWDIENKERKSQTQQFLQFGLQSSQPQQTNQFPQQQNLGGEVLKSVQNFDQGGNELVISFGNQAKPSNDYSNATLGIVNNNGLIPPLSPHFNINFNTSSGTVDFSSNNFNGFDAFNATSSSSSFNNSHFVGLTTDLSGSVSSINPLLGDLQRILQDHPTANLNDINNNNNGSITANFQNFNVINTTYNDNTATFNINNNNGKVEVVSIEQPSEQQNQIPPQEPSEDVKENVPPANPTTTGAKRGPKGKKGGRKKAGDKDTTEKPARRPRKARAKKNNGDDQQELQQKQVGQENQNQSQQDNHPISYHDILSTHSGFIDFSLNQTTGVLQQQTNTRGGRGRKGAGTKASRGEKAKSNSKGKAVPDKVEKQEKPEKEGKEIEDVQKNEGSSENESNDNKQQQPSVENNPKINENVPNINQNQTQTQNQNESQNKLNSTPPATNSNESNKIGAEKPPQLETTAPPPPPGPFSSPASLSSQSLTTGAAHVPHLRITDEFDSGNFLFGAVMNPQSRKNSTTTEFDSPFIFGSPPSRKNSLLGTDDGASSSSQNGMTSSGNPSAAPSGPNSLSFFSEPDEFNERNLFDD